MDPAQKWDRAGGTGRISWEIHLTANDAQPSSADARPPVARLEGAPIFRPLRPGGTMTIPIAAAGLVPPDAIVHRPAGTRVRRGELLVEKWPETSAAPLAPVDGRIVGPGVAKLTARLTAAAVIFEPDMTAAPPGPARIADRESLHQLRLRMGHLDLAAGLERLRQHGVWADRWTSPDLLGQLRGSIAKPIDTVLCNVLDESPELLLHGKVAGPFATEMAAGTLALAALTGAGRVWAAMAAFGDPAVWEKLRSTALGTPLKIVPIRDHYPQSHPSLLIHELAGRSIGPTRLPSESGILVLDAPAAVAVGRCFLNDEPMLTVPVGLHEWYGEETYWLDVPIGMSWSQILAQLAIDGLSIEIRAGNPLREVRLSADCIVAGGESSITLAPVERFVDADPCIRCAWCVEGCPVRIQPAGLLEAAQQDDPYLAAPYGLDSCIECGICSYVCPSHLPILAGIRALRASNAREARRRKPDVRVLDPNT